MTRYAPLWQQAGNYTAQVDRQLMAALWPSGGADGALPTATANTMLMNYPAGMCAVPLSGNNGVALCRWDAVEQVTVGAAPGAGTTRIDLVVCQVRDNALDSGANNDFWFVVVPGVPAAAPVPPATPANAYVMTAVTVPASVANLNTATITDRRSPLSAGVPHSAGAVNPGQALSWVQGGWGNWPPGPGLTVPFQKYRADTALRVYCATSAYVGPTNSNRAQIGFRVDGGADQAVGALWMLGTATQPRSFLAGSLVVRGLAAGLRTVTLRVNWPGTAASDSINYGTNEFCTMTVTEENP